MNKPVGWNAVAAKKAPLMINDVVRWLNEARRSIDEQAKYYNMQWKKDMLKALKEEALTVFAEAVDEAVAVSKQYEDKIDWLTAQQYTGARVNKDDIATVDYELRSLKAELNMAVDKNSVIERYLATQTGAKAVMLMFSEKDLDSVLWTKSIYDRAITKAKTKAEQEFEINKSTQIAELKAQQAQEFNIGTLLAAQRILAGSAGNAIPSLERQFDLDIEECDKAMRMERETLKAETRREIAREQATARGAENE